MTEPSHIPVYEDIYHAALAMEKLAEEFDIPACWLAELKMDMYRRKRNTRQVKFWKDVWNFEMTLDSSAAGTPILLKPRKK